MPNTVHEKNKIFTFAKLNDSNFVNIVSCIGHSRGNTSVAKLLVMLELIIDHLPNSHLPKICPMKYYVVKYWLYIGNNCNEMPLLVATKFINIFCSKRFSFNKMQTL